MTRSISGVEKRCLSCAVWMRRAWPPHARDRRGTLCLPTAASARLLLEHLEQLTDSTQA